MGNKLAASDLDLNGLITNSTPNFSGATTIGDLISKLIPYFFFFAGALLLLYLIMGGISLMTASGDPKAVGAAKSKITYALIGFFVVFTAYFIVQVLGEFLGLSGIGSVFS